MTIPGKLTLLPNVLTSEEIDIFQFVPACLEEVVTSLDGLIVENEKEARKYLKRFTFPEGKTFREVPLRVLNKHTKPKDLQELLEPVIGGEHWGVVSDAGLPCIADPGAALIYTARKRRVEIAAVTGPSSLTLSLMLSGLSAQKFFFHGYLKRGEGPLSDEVRLLEEEAKERSLTQVFIEAPHRSMQMFETLVKTLSSNTKLCVASHLTAKDEFVKTLSIERWKQEKDLDLHKKPTIFLIAT